MRIFLKPLEEGIGQGMLYWSIFAPPDVKVQNLNTHCNHHFIFTFAGVLFVDWKQPYEASIAPSQVQEALTFSNHHFEMLLQLGGTVRVPFDSLRL